MADKEDIYSTKRIDRLVRDMFTFTLENSQHIDEETAQISLQMTREKLVDICYACQTRNELHGMAETPVADVLIAENPPPAPKGREKRRMHLLRLVSCKLSHAFDKRNNPNALERGCSMGIDYFFRRLLGMAVYDQLNNQSQRILLVSGKSDADVFTNVMNNPFHRLFLQNILVRFALAFRDYGRMKKMLLADMDESLTSQDPPLPKGAFHTVMHSLLHDIFLLGKSEADDAMLDFLYGPKTALQLHEVAEMLADDRGGD